MTGSRQTSEKQLKASRENAEKSTGLRIRRDLVDSFL